MGQEWAHNLPYPAGNGFCLISTCAACRRDQAPSTNAEDRGMTGTLLHSGDLGIGLLLEQIRVAVDSTMRGLLEAAPDAIVIVDDTGRIVLVNAQVERLFGYERGDLLGQPVEVLVPPRYREGHPQRRASYFAQPSTRPM